jgi:hypothetical protein
LKSLEDTWALQFVSVMGSAEMEIAVLKHAMVGFDNFHEELNLLKKVVT